MLIERRGAEMKWLESTGGPMVVVPADLVAQWSGHRGDDYDLACSVDDVGVVNVARDGHALCAVSLWDEPMSTAYMDDLDCIVQWRWADSEERLLRDVHAAWGSLEWVEVGFLPGSGRVRMFDAAVPGDEVEVDDSIDWYVEGVAASVVKAEMDMDASACRLIRLMGTLTERSQFTDGGRSGRAEGQGARG